MFCFFLWSWLLIRINLAKTICFVVLVKFFVNFLARISACFFYCKIGVLHQIYICSFCFCHLFFTIVCDCAFDTFIPKPFAALARPKLCLLPSLFVFLASPKLALFFCHDHALPNIVLLAHLYIFFVLLCVPPCFKVPRLPSAYLIVPMHPPAQLYACTT